MRVLVVGAGIIARRHIRNLKLVDPAARIAVWRQSPRSDDLGELAASVECVFRSPEEALAWAPQAAVVASPAPFHVPQAAGLAERGVHLLIEKPLSDSLEGIEPLLRTCAERGVVGMVGYNLRFHAPLRILKETLAAGAIGRVLGVRAEVGQYLPDWRPGTDYRRSVSARRSLGGGALLELSHEIDCARWLGGEVADVCARVGRLSPLEIDVEDTAEILLRFESGALGSVHLDMIQRAPARWCRLIGSEGTLHWDGSDDSVGLFAASEGRWVPLRPPGQEDRNAMYVAELRHFLECVESGRTPAVSIEDGLRALRIALAAAESARTGHAVPV